jgi:hypothetical protein
MEMLAFLFMQSELRRLENEYSRILWLQEKGVSNGICLILCKAH